MSGPDHLFRSRFSFSDQPFEPLSQPREVASKCVPEAFVEEFQQRQLQDILNVVREMLPALKDEIGNIRQNGETTEDTLARLGDLLTRSQSNLMYYKINQSDSRDLSMLNDLFVAALDKKLCVSLNQMVKIARGAELTPEMERCLSAIKEMAELLEAMPSALCALENALLFAEGEMEAADEILELASDDAKLVRAILHETLPFNEFKSFEEEIIEDNDADCEDKSDLADDEGESEIACIRVEESTDEEVRSEYNEEDLEDEPWNEAEFASDEPEGEYNEIASDCLLQLSQGNLSVSGAEFLIENWNMVHEAFIRGLRDWMYALDDAVEGGAISREGDPFYESLVANIDLVDFQYLTTTGYFDFLVQLDFGK